MSAVALSVSVALGYAPGVLPSPDEAGATAPEQTATSEGSGDPASEGSSEGSSEVPAVPETDAAAADVEPEPTPSLDDALYEEAHDRYVEGKELFLQRRYLDAAAMFRRSYAAVPTGRSLYAAGLSYEKGGDLVQALEAYRRYLDLPDCPAPELHCAGHRSEVTESEAKLRAKVAELSIDVDDGVELLGIEIGDRIIPVEDFPIILAPGHYEIRERGYAPSEVRIREIDVEAGQVFSLLIVDFGVSDKPPSSEVVDPGPPSRPSNRLTEEERRRRLRVAFYSGVGVTAVAGVATGIVGGLTWRAYRDQKDRCRGEGVNCTGTVYPMEDRERVEQLRPVTNALVGVTAGLGITTVVLGLFAFTGAKGKGARASVTRVTPTPGGVRVRF